MISDSIRACLKAKPHSLSSRTVANHSKAIYRPK